jgi:hypothetical protein
MARQSHPPRLDYSNYTWRRVQIIKLLVMQLSPCIIIIIIIIAIVIAIMFNRHSAEAFVLAKANT